MRKLVTMATAGILAFLTVVTAGCGPAGPPGPAGPSGPPGPAGPAGGAAPASKSKASLAVFPAVQEASAGKTVTFLASGLEPKQEVRLRISTQPEMDITLIGARPPQISPGGALEIQLDVSAFPVGTYTVKLVGAGDEVLATAPFKVFKPAPPAKPKP